MSEIHLRNLDLNLLITFQTLMDERSVTRAAEVLGRTPSAISHALGRLREQLDDPLLVKVGNRMQPSPRAERLHTEIKPLLLGMQRAVQPRSAFDPATTTRLFTISGPAVAIFNDIIERIAGEAPLARVDWQPPQQKTFELITSEEVDVAFGIANIPLPDGLTCKTYKPMERYVLARKGHPAIRNWDVDEWLRWPHVVVRIPTAIKGTVGDGLEMRGLRRVVGARVANWGQVAPTLRRTNMLANQILAALDPRDIREDLAILSPPEPIPHLPLRLVWNRRVENDPAIAWVRSLVDHCIADALARGEKLARESEIIEAKHSKERLL